MAVSVTLFLVHPTLGARDEDDLQAVDDLAALLGPRSEAGLEITSGLDEIVIRDELDDLISGVCIGGAQVFEAGGTHTHVSFAGFDSVEMSADADLAHFVAGEDALEVPRDEVVDALRAQAKRFGQLLKRVFPDDQARWGRFVEGASG